MQPSPPSRLPPDPRAELSFIRSVIEDSRRAIVFDATPFLVWGGLVVAGVAAEYLVDFDPVWIWMALIGAGWIYSIASWMRHRARARVRTLADRALASVWVGCWTAMTLVGFVGYFSGHLSGSGITASLAIIMGAGFFATGTLVADRLVRLIGIGWWLVGTVIYLWDSPYTLAFFAVMIVLLQIMPGVVLQRRWRSELRLP